MPTITRDKKVSDLTVEELKGLIRDTLYDLIDPDRGLELRDEIEERLRESAKQKKRGEGIPLKAVKKQLGLK